MRSKAKADFIVEPLYIGGRMPQIPVTPEDVMTRYGKYLQKLKWIAACLGLWIALLGVANAQASLTVMSVAAGQAQVSPDSWAMAVGSNLASATQSGGSPSTELGGVTVTVGGLPAIILYVSPQRVDFVVPSGCPLGAQPVLLTTGGQTITGQVQVVSAAPGVFKYQTLRSDRAIAADASLGTVEPFAASTGPGQHSRINIWGTGWRHANDVSVTLQGIDGLLPVSATVEQAADAGYPGLDYLRVVVPDVLKNAGIVTLNIQVNASSTTPLQSPPVTVQFGEASFDTVSLPPYLASTVAGSGYAGYAGDLGQAVAGLLSNPTALAMDRAHNLYIADSENHVVRKVAPGGLISTFAGTGSSGNSGDGGPASQAQLDSPVGVAVDRLGNVFVADKGSHRIRMIDTHGNIQTVAGSGSPGDDGDGDLAIFAQLNSPSAVATDRFGNLYIADTGNHRVREITGGDNKIRTLAGEGIAGNSGAGGWAPLARLDSPNSVAADAEGTVFIADSVQHIVSAVDPDGTIRLIAGTGQANDSGDEGSPVAATFRGPLSVMVDRLSRLWIADGDSHRVRIVALDNMIHAAAATGADGSNGDGGPALAASLRSPLGMASDPAGNVFVADANANNVRALTETTDCSAAPALRFAPQLAVGGQSVTGYLRIACPLQADTVFNLGADLAGVVIPLNATILKGETTTTFSMTTPVVTQNQTVTVSANNSGASVSDSFVASPGAPTVSDPAPIVSITMQNPTVVGGYSLVGRILLGGPAPAGGKVIPLVVDNAAAVVAQNVTIPAGELTADFLVTTSPVQSPTIVHVTGGTGDGTKTTTFTILPAALGQILSLVITPNTVQGGATTTGFVTLAAPAPYGGVVVFLSSNNGAATVPAGIIIPEGLTEGIFTVSTSPVTAQQSITITATSANSVSAGLTVTTGSGATSAPKIQSLLLNPASATGGNSATGTVVLDGPATPGGMVVILTSDRSGVTVPGSITIAAGQTQGTFTVNTTPVSSTITAGITAAAANSVEAWLTLDSTPPGQGQILSVSLNPSTVNGGSPSSGTVTLSAPAPSNGVLVQLTSDNSAATLASSIVIPSGQSIGSFQVNTSPTASTQVAHITATSANSASAALTINASGAGLGQLAGLVVNPSTVTGGQSSTGTVTLSSPAPTGGILVTLASNNSFVTVPGSITIPSGQTSGIFAVTTLVTGSVQTAGITATSANTVSATLVVNPTPPGYAQIAGLTLNPLNVIGGSPSTGTVTLSSPAPVNGVLVNLSSNNPSATVPASITIPAGQTGGSFTVNTSPVGAAQTASIGATSANSVSATLNINVTAPGQGQIAGLTLNPTTVTGGLTSTGTVTLSNPAPANGVLVSLASNNPSATVLASITILSGGTTGSFTVNTSAVGAQQTANITATSANSVGAVLTINATPPGQGQIAGLALNPTSVTGGSPSTGTVTLSNPAPANGVLVNLGSNNSSATVQASITIPGGGTSASFTVNTTSVAAIQTSTITATSANSANASLTINPALCVQNLNLNASITSLLTGQGLINGTVTLTGPAPQGGSTIQLAAGSVNLGTVFVPAGQTSAPVSLNVANIVPLLGSVIQAVFNGCPLITGTLTLAPGQSGPAFLTSLSLNPTSLTGATGNPVGTVTIANPAPAGGVLVVLQSSNSSAVSVPASVTIPASQTSANFSMTTGSVSADTNVTISATSANTLQATFNDKSACVSGLVLSVKVTNLLTGQGLLSGSVSLTGPAPAGGATVGLVGLNTNVAVPQGSTSAPVSLSVANAVTLIGSTVTGLLGSCPGFPVTVQLGL